VTSNPAGVSVGDCSAVFSSSTAVAFDRHARRRSTFTAERGGCSGIGLALHAKPATTVAAAFSATGLTTIASRSDHVEKLCTHGASTAIVAAGANGLAAFTWTDATLTRERLRSRRPYPRVEDRREQSTGARQNGAEYTDPTLVPGETMQGRPHPGAAERRQRAT